MDQMESVLQEKLRPGAIVVSNSFVFPAWPELHIEEQEHVYVCALATALITLPSTLSVLSGCLSLAEVPLLLS